MTTWSFESVLTVLLEKFECIKSLKKSAKRHTKKIFSFLGENVAQDTENGFFLSVNRDLNYFYNNL